MKSEIKINVLTNILHAINDVTEKDITSISEDQKLIEIGLHSLLLYKFVTKIEDIFEITIDYIDLEAKNFETVESVKRLLEKYGIRVN